MLPYARFLHYLSLEFLQQSPGLQPWLSKCQSSSILKPELQTWPRHTPIKCCSRFSSPTWRIKANLIGETKLSRSPVLHLPLYFNTSNCLQLHVQTLLFHASMFLPVLFLLSGIPTPSYPAPLLCRPNSSSSFKGHDFQKSFFDLSLPTSMLPQGNMDTALIALCWNPFPTRL